LWKENTKLDSLWYNWPVILGKFETYLNCVKAYQAFAREHREHKDPVYFRAAVFAAVLASWYKKYQFVVDYRVGAKFSTDIEIFSKIHYHSAKRLRLLELMCITQFLLRVHNVMIMNACVELSTQRGPVFDIYDNQVSICKECAALAKRLQQERKASLSRQVQLLKHGQNLKAKPT